MLECKHKVRQLVCMRTRGQVTAVSEDGWPPILAKASVKPPGPKEGHNAYMLNLYLNRRPGQKTDSSHMVSTRKMWLTGSDMVEVRRSVKLNLEFDMKRRPLNPRMVAVGDVSHLALDTVPWTNKEEGELARAIFDGWRVDHVLKTIPDWEAWEEYYAARLMARNSGMKVTAEGAVGIARRTYLRAYARGTWGIEHNRTYADTAAWLTAVGYPTHPDDLKNAKRAKLMEGIVPVTRRVMALMKILFVDQPALELEKFFGPGTEAAQVALACARDGKPPSGSDDA